VGGSSFRGKGKSKSLRGDGEASHFVDREPPFKGGKEPNRGRKERRLFSTYSGEAFFSSKEKKKQRDYVETPPRGW